MFRKTASLLVGLCLITSFWAWQNGQDNGSPAEPSAGHPLLEQAKRWEQEADTLFENGFYIAAIDILEQAAQVYLKEQQWREYVYVLNDIAGNYSFNNEVEKSLIFSDRAIKFASKFLPKQDSLLGYAYANKAEQYLIQGNFDSAYWFFQTSQPIFEANKLWVKAAYAELGESVIAFYQGAYADMDAHLRTALEYIKNHQITDEDLNSLVFHLFGVLYDTLGDYDKALDIAKEALQIRLGKPHKNRDDSLLIAGIYNNIGAVYYTRGDYDQAIEYHDQALLLKKANADTQESRALSLINLALCRALKGEQSQSLSVLQQSLSILSKTPETSANENILLTFNAIARNYLLQEQADSALTYLQQAQKIAVTDSPAHTAILQRQAEAYLIKGQFAKALQWAEKAKAAFEKMYGTKHPGLAEHLVLLARIHQQAGKSAWAASVAEDALGILGYLPQGQDQSISDKRVAIEALEIKAAFLQQNGQLLEALQGYRQIASLIDQMLGEYQAVGSKQFLLKRSRQLYEQAIQLCFLLEEQSPGEQYFDLAFEFAEKSKAVLLLERIRNSEVKLFLNIPDSIRLMEKELKRDIAFFQKQYFEENSRENGDTLKLRLWQERLFELKRQLEQLETELEKNYPEYYDLKFHPPSIDLVALREKWLPNHGRLIEYFVGDSSVYVFDLAPGGKKYHVFAKPSDFEAQIFQLRALLAQAPQAAFETDFFQFTEQAHAQYRQLLAPVLSEKDSGQLTIIPDQTLNYLPFETLLRQPFRQPQVNYSQPDYLLRHFQLNYGFSAALLLKATTSAEPPPASVKYLAFAPFYDNSLATNTTRDDAGITPLPGTRREIETLAKHFKAGAHFQGSAATEAEFKKQVAQYDLIHLATHGLADHQNPLYSKLLFQKLSDGGEDGQLHTYELYNMLLRARLVVLSACETGYGQFVQGEGVMSLASGFLHTGCSAITMSLWEAQDVATSMIMDAYYAALAQGVPKCEALRQAKLQYLALPGVQKHPYYWAAFVNVGDTAPLIVPPKGGHLPWWGWVLLGMGALVAGWGWFWVSGKVMIRPKFPIRSPRN
ncbi:MAG TPA: CHAT domain-containing protein [Saprospiraceae bacterium]|nr:CHAT domain-containing protein [Saprospiraceae bacterium]HMQ82479.1 CHAT domain-containing protein [Saprospiraceae bacterium]